MTRTFSPPRYHQPQTPDVSNLEKLSFSALIQELISLEVDLTTLSETKNVYAAPDGTIHTSPTPTLRCSLPAPLSTHRVRLKIFELASSPRCACTEDLNIHHSKALVQARWLHETRHLINQTASHLDSSDPAFLTDLALDLNDHLVDLIHLDLDPGLEHALNLQRTRLTTHRDALVSRLRHPALVSPILSLATSLPLIDPPPKQSPKPPYVAFTIERRSTLMGIQYQSHNLLRDIALLAYSYSPFDPSHADKHPLLTPYSVYLPLVPFATSPPIPISHSSPALIETLSTLYERSGEDLFSNFEEAVLAAAAVLDKPFCQTN